MIVLHPNPKQYNTLNGYKYKNNELEFLKDGSDKWFVTLDVLKDPNFSSIHDQLDKLERIEYTPFNVEEDE
jgi:hypothetical protein